MWKRRIQVAIRYPIIPNTIIVHLGAPSDAARDIVIPFTDYISNVASSELYPTWPINALKANIYAIISFALNRIYNDFYTSNNTFIVVTGNFDPDEVINTIKDYIGKLNLKPKEIPKRI